MAHEDSHEGKEFAQIINTAIVKSKEKQIGDSYEERLVAICRHPALKALNVAIGHLSSIKKISQDQAAIELIEAIRELDSIWDDYVRMEGLTKLKELLKSTPQ